MQLLRPQINVRDHSAGWHERLDSSQGLRRASTASATATVGHTDVGQQPKVAVATTAACPYCKRAKEALRNASIPFTEVDVSQSSELREALRELTGSRTVPQVFVEGRSIGGSDVVLDLLTTGELQQRLQSATLPPLPQQLQQLFDAEAHSVSQPQNEDQDAVPAALQQVLDALDSSLPRAPVSAGSLTYPAFTDAQLLQAIQESLEASGASASTAWEVARQLCQRRLIAPLPGQPFSTSDSPEILFPAVSPPPAGAATVLRSPWHWCLAREAPPPARGQALNAVLPWVGPARPAGQVAADMRALIVALYDTHLSVDGRHVQYQAMRSDPRFRQYIMRTAELQKADLTCLPPPELKALTINLYNALIIHATVVHGTPKDAVQRTAFFTSLAKYNVGGMDLTADDMEHGVLRGDRASAGHLFNLVGLHRLAGPHFRAGDPRKALALPACDPRIHFALVCGAKSCPPIKIYSPESLEEALTAAAEAFCDGEVAVDIAARTVTLSKIFKWYAMDFGSSPRERLEAIRPYLRGAAAFELTTLLSTPGSLHVKYREYDWGANGDE